MTQAATSTAPPPNYDVFTELDPLGTGRSRPYVDKKLFFQELKNPPKKVLKDLVPSAHTLLTDIGPAGAEAAVATPAMTTMTTMTTMTSLSRHSGGSVAISKQAQPYSGGLFAADPFAETDPFDNTDPFSDTFKDDPFTSMQEPPKLGLGRLDDPKPREPDRPEMPLGVDATKNVFNGPLQVTLPPEPAPKSPRLQRQVR